MKIAIFNESNFGSTGNLCNLIADSLSNDNEFVFFSYKCINKKDFHSKIESNCLEYQFNRYLCKFDGSDGFRNKRATAKVLKKLDNFKPDCFFFNVMHGHYINIEMLINYAIEKNIQIFWTLHDCWIMTGRCAHFDFFKCNKWNTEKCKKCPYKQNYPQSFVIDKSAFFYDKKRALFEKAKKLITLICPSQWIYDFVLKSKIPFKKIVLINNSVASFCLDKSAINTKDEIVIFSLAYPFTEKKGYEKLKEIIKKTTDKNISFVIGGLSSKQLKELSIFSNVKLYGKVESKTELIKLYSSADYFLNPTQEDTFPTTNIEALCCGTKVLTYDVGGSSEIVRKNDSFGYVFNDFNSLHLTKVIREEKEKISTIANELFSRNEMIKKYEEVFKL